MTLAFTGDAFRLDRPGQVSLECWPAQLAGMPAALLAALSGHPEPGGMMNCEQGEERIRVRAPGAPGRRDGRAGAGGWAPRAHPQHCRWGRASFSVEGAVLCTEEGFATFLASTH